MSGIEPAVSLGSANMLTCFPDRSRTSDQEPVKDLLKFYQKLFETCNNSHGKTSSIFIIRVDVEEKYPSSPSNRTPPHSFPRYKPRNVIVAQSSHPDQPLRVCLPCYLGRYFGM